MLVEKYGWTIQIKLICRDQSRFYIFHTPENSKMFNITLKYFRFFNNKLPVSWVLHITRDFLICYSCSYYSSLTYIYIYMIYIFIYILYYIIYYTLYIFVYFYIYIYIYIYTIYTICTWLCPWQLNANKTDLDAFLTSHKLD